MSALSAKTGASGRGATARIALAILLSAAAASPLLRVFGSAGARLILFAVPPAGVLAGVVTALGGRRSTWAPPLGWISGLIAGALPGIALAAADPYTPAGLAPRVGNAVTEGWRVLVSVPVPAPNTAGFTSLPLIIVAAATALAAVLAAGSRPASALIPTTLVFSGLLVLGVHGSVSALWLAGAYCAAALLYLGTVSESVPTWRGVVTATANGLVILAAAALGVTAMSGASPYDPRAGLVPPVQSASFADPLSQLSEQTAHPATRVFTATLSGALRTHPRNWVVLAYDEYNGAQWRAETNARPAEVARGSADAVGSGSANVTLDGATALLPHPASVLADGPLGLDYDRAHELLLGPGGSIRYTVSVAVSEPAATALTDAAIPPDAETYLTALPSCMPAELRQLASKAQSAAGLPDEQAAALEQELRAAPYAYDLAAPPGEGCGSLERMLATGHGTSAQFATAFALAARAMGLPSRVVSGYLPGKVSGDTVTVTDADAYSWPQVLFTGVGWVDFDPTPTTNATAAAPPREQQGGLKQVLNNVANGNTTTVRKGGGGTTHHTTGGARSPLYWAVPATGLPVLFLLAWIAVARIRRLMLRRRRRAAASPPIRVLGAWEEMLDPLQFHRVAVSGRTAPKIAAALASLLPGVEDEAARLADLAERALYDVVGEPEADEAWRLSDVVRRALVGSLGWKGRLRRTLFARLRTADAAAYPAMPPRMQTAAEYETAPSSE